MCVWHRPGCTLWQAVVELEVPMLLNVLIKRKHAHAVTRASRECAHPHESPPAHEQQAAASCHTSPRAHLPPRLICDHPGTHDTLRRLARRASRRARSARPPPYTQSRQKSRCARPASHNRASRVAPMRARRPTTPKRPLPISRLAHRAYLHKGAAHALHTPPPIPYIPSPP